MRVLVSTFGQGDSEKVIEAMRQLPYEKLVLIGTAEMPGSPELERMEELEEMSGHRITFEEISDEDFMELVGEISDILERHAKGLEAKETNKIALNISGGAKLLGDASLFAAFRLGIEAYHCDKRLTKLPVVKGATARDRFTPSQQKFLEFIGDGWIALDEVARKVSPESRQSTERLMRELRKAGLVRTELVSGKIQLALSSEGAEVARAVKASRAR